MEYSFLLRKIKSYKMSRYGYYYTTFFKQIFFI